MASVGGITWTVLQRQHMLLETCFEKASSMSVSVAAETLCSVQPSSASAASSPVPLSSHRSSSSLSGHSSGRSGSGSLRGLSAQSCEG